MSLVKFDNHTLQTFRQCPRKGYYRHIRGLVSGGGGEGGWRSSALEFGIATHTALDTLYRERDLLKSTASFLEAYQPFWDELEPEFKAKEKRTPEFGIQMLLGYWTNWADQIMSLEVVAVEQYFEFQLAPNVKYCGKIDKVFRDTVSGKLVGMDHKTTSRLTNAYISSLRIFQQFRGYMYYLKYHSPWKDEMGDYFYADFLLTAKSFSGGSPYYRDTILADKDALNEWRIGTLAQIETINTWDRLALENDQQIPQHTDACADYNSLCTFYDICQAHPAMRDTTIETVYTQDFWDPALH